MNTVYHHDRDREWTQFTSITRIGSEHRPNHTNDFKFPMMLYYCSGLPAGLMQSPFFDNDAYKWGRFQYNCSSSFISIWKLTLYHSSQSQLQFDFYLQPALQNHFLIFICSLYSRWFSVYVVYSSANSCVFVTHVKFLFTHFCALFSSTLKLKLLP